MFELSSLVWAMALLPIVGVVIGIALSAAAIRRFNRAHQRIGAVPSACGLNGVQVARTLLARNGMSECPVDVDSWQSQYRFKDRAVLLRSDHAATLSVAGLAVASHEVGHAEQHRQCFWAMRLARRGDLVGMLVLSFVVFSASFSVVRPSERMIVPITAAVAGTYLILQAIVVIAQEVDANRRARRMVREAEIIRDDEWLPFEEILRVGMLTYFALIARMGLALLGLTLGLVLGPYILGDGELNGNPAVPGAGAGGAIEWFQDPALFVPVFAAMVSFGVLFMIGRGNRRSRTEQSLPAAYRAVDAHHRGAVLMADGDFSGAVRYFNRAIREDRSQSATYYCRAQALMRMGRFDAAEEDLEDWFSIEDEVSTAGRAKPDPWLTRGSVRLHRKKYAEAEVDFNRAFALRTDSADAYRDRGTARLFLNRPHEALGDFDEALRRVPDCGVTHNNRGAALYDLGRYDEAIEEFRTAIRLEPKLPHPHRRLAKLRWECPDEQYRDRSAAIASARTAVELGDEDPMLPEILKAGTACASNG